MPSIAPISGAINRPVTFGQKASNLRSPALANSRNLCGIEVATLAAGCAGCAALGVFTVMAFIPKVRWFSPVYWGYAIVNGIYQAGKWLKNQTVKGVKGTWRFFTETVPGWFGRKKAPAPAK